jgi:uncharacterized protein
VNDSPSTISPAWPTRWPKDSFTGVGTWLFAGFIVLLLLILLGLVIVAAVVMKSRPGMVQPAVTPALLDYSLLGQSIGEGALVAGLLVALPRLSKFTLRELGFRVPQWSTIGIALLGAVAMIVVSNGLASLIDSVLHSAHQQDVVAIFKDLHDRTSLAILSVYAIVLAPFFEETIFRIFFFNIGLRFGGFWLGAIVSGLLFGIAHGDLYAAIPLALGGMILCGVYYRSENAWASMISHSCFNAVSILAIVFFPKLV